MNGGVQPRVRIPLTWLPVRGRPEPTWQQARPGRIARSLEAARGRNPGGWCVVGGVDEVPTGRSVVRRVAGYEVVLWRTSSGMVAAGSASCPHLGALLDGCVVAGDAVVCRWHGLEVGPGPGRGWRPYPVHDDGALIWVQVPVPGETPTAAPLLPDRPDPSRSVAAVVAVPGVCTPDDIIANRLDPWHGAWFHPYAFSHLSVDESASSDDVLVLDVAFRVVGGLAVPVRAQFACPDARTIVMTILGGEGAGSVVETHATPIGVDRDGHPVTMMVELTVASSDRVGFQVARRLAPLLQIGMRYTARRLWVDDMVYAERLYQVRTRSSARGRRPS